MTKRGRAGALDTQVADLDGRITSAASDLATAKRRSSTPAPV
jgi:hypothetical protein